MKKQLPLLFLILLVSGCTIPGTDIDIPFLPDVFGSSAIGTSDIIVIKQLSAYPEKIREDQTIRLTAYIQNVGTAVGTKGDVDNVEVNLYDFCTGVFEIQETTCAGVGGSGSTCKTGKMHPKETKEVSWLLKPKAPLKIETPCTLKISAGYEFETTVLSTINFISADELKRQMESGSYKTKTSTQIASEGPVKPSIKVLEPQPIPVPQGGGKTLITFEIADRGSGFVPQSENKYKLWVKELTYTYDNKGKCIFPTDNQKDKEVPFGSNKQEQITLMREKSSIINCDLEKPPVEKERSDNVKITINYDYEVRKEKKVTVTPLPERL